MKRKDLILIGVILGIAFVSIGVMQFVKGKDGAVIRIIIDGSLYGTYSLASDQTIEIDMDAGSNTVVIKNGQALMSDADCPDLYCVKHKPVSKDSETIVCLPHKIVVQVDSEEEFEADAVAR